MTTFLLPILEDTDLNENLEMDSHKELCYTGIYLLT